jgi:sialic acid synthase SpsE
MKKLLKIYCEIGLNHMGSEENLIKYLNVLSDPNVDGITIQLPKKSFYTNNIKFKNFELKKQTILIFLNLAKKYKKEIGFATNNINLVKFFKKKINFIKILSQNFSDIRLVKKFYSLNLPMYLSVGFNSIKEIKNILSRLNIKNLKNKTTLLHTSFDKKTNLAFNNGSKEDFSLKRIKNLKDNFDMKVGFLNHYKKKNKIIDSVKYNPDAIFFYIKLNKKLNYPDKDWAINVNDVKKLTKKLTNLRQSY